MEKYETQENDPLSHYDSSRDQLTRAFTRPKWLRVGARTQMILLFTLGIGAGLAHHFFYTFLHNRPADGGVFTSVRSALRTSASDQSIVNLFGNVISKVGGGALAAVVGTAFAQFFWWRIRRESTPLEAIDATMDFKANPLNVFKFSWKAFLTMFWLYVVAVMAALMELISVITPGTLTVATLPFDESCTVKTVDLSRADLTGLETKTGDVYEYSAPNGRAYGHVTKVLMSGTYYPPTSPCGICEYDVTFIAPAVQCQNITQQTDFSAVDGLFEGSSSAYVWNGDRDHDDNLYGYRILSRNIIGDSPSTIPPASQLPVIALNCTGWKATYHVHVAHNTSAVLTVTNIEIGQHLNIVDLAHTTNLLDHQVLALWDALVYQTRGTVTYSYGSNTFDSDPAYVAWSSLSDGSSTGIAWQWPGNLQDLFPVVMQNASLSLLSGELSDDDSPTVVDQDTTCRVSSPRFVYKRARLLGTYATGFALAVACLVLGFACRASNDANDPATLDFSRILLAYPQGESLDLESKVKATREGILRPV